MAPSSQPAYAKDERVLCFHHELLYEAKVLDSKLSDATDKKSPLQYRVHYKGWKNTWDDWVPQDRLRKLTDENKELAQNLKKEMDALRHRTAPPKAPATSIKKKAAGSDLSSGRGSEERHSSLPATGRGQKRGRDYEIEKEESFLQRPAVRIVIPDHLKAILVDDWENVTKNLSLVPLPSKHPVNEILDAYWDEEKGKRRYGSAEADLLEEVVAGVREYFEKCLGRILLYRFEREQFFEVRQLWEAGTGEWEGKGAGDVYGAEHLCRLFVTMPELIAQTNMDQQSVNRLREELAKLTQWLGKNSSRFFTSDYEAATQDYIEKARGV
ncbi:histone acetylase complex subunit [Lasallia pustulata]|uniref:Chromatin modification-related protein EAF3 n=1 Tax=Lasallia pustulata TaxID=136370 RepID=A0A1W5CRN4_9LECA|nr:histone acetylase complex subunit [Lasallia pustulata]